VTLEKTCWGGGEWLTRWCLILPVHHEWGSRHGLCVYTCLPTHRGEIHNKKGNIFSGRQNIWWKPKTRDVEYPLDPGLHWTSFKVCPLQYLCWLVFCKELVLLTWHRSLQQKMLQAIVLFRVTYLLANRPWRESYFFQVISDWWVSLLMPRHFRVLILPRSNLNK